MTESVRVSDVPPRLRRLDGEADARGFPSARAFRVWCERRGVRVYADGEKLLWVDADAVAAVLRDIYATPAPAVARAGPRPPSARREATSAVDAIVRRSQG